MTSEKKSLESRLSTYSRSHGTSRNAQWNNSAFLLTASAAAGLGALLCPPPTEAAVQYSGHKDITLGTNTFPALNHLDLNGDGIDDFAFAFINQGIH